MEVMQEDFDSILQLEQAAANGSVSLQILTDLKAVTACETHVHALWKWQLWCREPSRHTRVRGHATNFTGQQNSWRPAWTCPYPKEQPEEQATDCASNSRIGDAAKGFVRKKHSPSRSCWQKLFCADVQADTWSQKEEALFCFGPSIAGAMVHNHGAQELGVPFGGGASSWSWSLCFSEVLQTMQTQRSCGVRVQHGLFSKFATWSSLFFPSKILSKTCQAYVGFVWVNLIGVSCYGQLRRASRAQTSGGHWTPRVSCIGLTLLSLQIGRSGPLIMWRLVGNWFWCAFKSLKVCFAIFLVKSRGTTCQRKQTWPIWASTWVFCALPPRSSWKCRPWTSLIACWIWFAMVMWIGVKQLKKQCGNQSRQRLQNRQTDLAQNWELCWMRWSSQSCL